MRIAMLGISEFLPEKVEVVEIVVRRVMYQNGEIGVSGYMLQPKRTSCQWKGF